MAGRSQTLEAKLGPELFAKFRALVEGAQGTETPYSISKAFNASENVYVAPSTVKNYVERGFPVTENIIRTLPLAVPDSAAPAVPSPQLNVVLRENARLRAKLAERESGWEIIRGVLEEVYTEPLNIEVLETKISELPGSPETAVMHVTDVHWAKVTPSYDISICEARMLQYFNAVSEITELRRRTAPIDECVLLLGGDMIESEGIFPHQAWETQVDLIEQMVKGGPEYCVNLVLSAAQLFPKLRIHAVNGNHGRMGKFMSPQTNADAVFYEIVRKMVTIASPEAASRIEWDLPMDRPRGHQWFSRFDIIGPWSGLLVHGDQVKGQMGYSFYGWGKKIQGWNSAKDTRGFTHCFGGHWHTHGSFDVNSVTMFATGSPESSNCYALETMGAAGEPKQRLVFMNERYGTLADYPVILN